MQHPLGTVYIIIVRIQIKSTQEQVY